MATKIMRHAGGSAEEAHAVAKAETQDLIRRLAAKVKAMECKGGNWGYVGDMNHVRQELRTLLAGLS